MSQVERTNCRVVTLSRPVTRRTELMQTVTADLTPAGMAAAARKGLSPEEWVLQVIQANADDHSCGEGDLDELAGDIEDRAGVILVAISVDEHCEDDDCEVGDLSIDSVMDAEPESNGQPL